MTNTETYHYDMPNKLNTSNWVMYVDRGQHSPGGTKFYVNQ